MTAGLDTPVSLGRRHVPAGTLPVPPGGGTGRIGGLYARQVFPPTDVRVDERNVYAPDLIWFSEPRVPGDLDAYPAHLPDLCVEIRSQGTWRYDIGAKQRRYEAAGLPELWLVDDAARSALVYRRSEADSRRFDIALELDCEPP